MTYIGEIVPLHFEVTVGDVDTDPTTIVMSIVHPDGSSDPETLNHDGTGTFDTNWDTTGELAGRHTWIALSTGTGQAVATGVIDLIDPFATSPTLTAVQPWTDAAAVRQRSGCSDFEQGPLDLAARAATDVLYALSGRQFTGRHVITVRPTAARRSGRVGSGWLATWGSCALAGAAAADWEGHACSCRPAQIELGAYPITQVITVKIDGVTIPDTEWTVYDHRILVRSRATAAAPATARDGWPTCQRLDLPDTQSGTFSVTFAYGTPPPPAGVAAATSLAAELALVWSDADSATRLPARVQTIARQGESITLIDPQDVLDKGRTGIPEVDMFLKAANPAGLVCRSSVWSPDTSRVRRAT